MPGARYTKSFNTLTSGFQAVAATRIGEKRVVQWIAGDDLEAKAVGPELTDVDQVTAVKAPPRVYLARFSGHGRLRFPVKQ
jgi:hypothetical protein